MTQQYPHDGRSIPATFPSLSVGPRGVSEATRGKQYGFVHRYAVGEAFRRRAG